VPAPWEIGGRCSVTGLKERWRARWREPLKEVQMLLEGCQLKMDVDYCSPYCISYTEVTVKLRNLRMREEVGRAEARSRFRVGGCWPTTTEMRRLMQHTTEENARN
jgi:hypothetical protein